MYTSPCFVIARAVANDELFRPNIFRGSVVNIT